MKDEFADRVFDYFVEELVTQQPPPDLSARITAAWEQEKKACAGLPSSAHQDLVTAEIVESPCASADKANTTVGDAETVDTECTHTDYVDPLQPSAGVVQDPWKKRMQRRRRWESRNLLAVLLAISACVSLALLTWRLPNSSSGQPGVAVEDPMPDTAENSVGRIDVPGEPTLVDNFDSQPPAAEVLDIRGLPFAGDATGSSPNSPAESVAVADAAALDSTEIIRRIDNRLAEIWQSAQVSPTPQLSLANRLRRVSMLMTGASPVDNSAEPASEIDAWVSREVGSQAFARHWAKQFAEQWLSHSSLPLDSEPVAQLEKTLATHIHSGQPWNEVANTLLGGPLDVQDTTSPTATFVTALAGNGNHRLVERLGSGFLDANLGCVRCHDASDDRRQPSLLANQKGYWTLVALLQGVGTNGKSAIGERGPVDRQPELVAGEKLQLVYFDLLDGRLQAAEPKLPTGENWQSVQSAQLPRQALASWISQSPQMDLATVNLVWKFIFGKHLVPQIIDIDEVAISQREELQRELAEQFRLHNRDVRQLVSWIVRSDAVSRQTLSLNSADWLSASNEQLAKLQVADTVFATGAMRTPTSVQPLENVLSSLVKWQSDKPRAATLAQPVPGVPPKSPKKTRATGNNSSNVPSLGYVLHGEQPTAAEVDFVNRLLASKRLSWTQCVAHIVALNANRHANGRIQQLAAEILQQHSGDTAAALLDLLWAVKSST